MQKVLLFLLFLGLSLNSCTFYYVPGEPYDKRKEARKEYIHLLTSFDQLEKGIVYEINGPQLLEELSKHENSLVYIYSHGACGEYCYSLATVEEYAKDQNLNLYLILRSYASLEELMETVKGATLYGVDADYYKSRGIRNKYIKRKHIRKFEEDIKLDDYRSDHHYDVFGEYYFYKGNQLDTVVQDILKYQPN